MTIQKTLQQESFESLIIPIKSVEPDGDYTELEAMRPFFENKEIVALGESTHGTKEFWTYRHRMIRYMVENLGFRIICLESNFSSTQMLNNYIKGGDGTSIQAVQALGGYIYNTKEFLNLIEWLRSYNLVKSDADKVVFYGFDAQKTEAAAEIVKSYIATTDPAYISTFNSVAEPFLNEFSELDQYTMDQFIKESNALFLKYNSKWEIIQTYLTNNKAKLIEQSSEKDFTLIEQHWKIVKLRFTQMSKINEIESFNYRDSYMAENSNWIYNFEGKRKMILLAHAGHIGNSNSLETQMGYHLKKTHQDKYYAIGLFFNEGSVYAAGLVDGKPQLAEFKLPAKPKHTITRAFVQGGWSSFFLSFSSIASKPSLVNLFKSEYNTYFIGADLENVTVKQILGQFYDGIIFLEKVNGTTPN